MHPSYIFVSFILSIASALPGSSPSPSYVVDPPPYYNTTYLPQYPTTVDTTYTISPSWTPTYSNYGPTYTHVGGDCGDDCGGVCGDGKVQYPEECDLGYELNHTPGSGCDSNCRKCRCGDGIVDPGEECDAGQLNGFYNSGCSTDCKFCGYCGDGIVDDAAGEQCDLGWNENGKPGANCTSNCTICEVPPVTCKCTCCGEGTATGSTWAECEANCEAKCNSTCPTCNPIPSLNFCDITTSCINTPKNDYCACRAGYRADGLLPTDPKQFRLAFPGQEYRVFVAPGVVCNTLCTNPFPGPISCQEVPLKDTC